jgi:hypothetical protein
MKRDSRSKWIAFRRALWASAAFHAVVVGALVLLLRTSEQKPRAAKGIDTLAPDESQVRISWSEENTVRMEVPVSQDVAKPQAAETDASPAPRPESIQTTKPEVSSTMPALPSKPFALNVPQTLPTELIALIRKPAGAGNPPVGDSNVRPAGGVVGVPAMHGALAPGKTVVYVLDASGSMGAAGKFDAARAALISTLRQQPGTVKFQVIVYANTATPLLTSDTGGLAATAANTRAAAEKLAALEPRGKSNHLVAIHTALAFRPDVILLLTDAEELSAATVRPVLASASRPVVVCVGHVTEGGVQRPRELK